MFPLKRCSFTVCLARFVQQNSLPSSSKKLANRKNVSIPTICFCTTSGAAYLCIFHLWLVSNWLSCSNILLHYVVFLEAFHCCKVLLFSPACWYVDLLCVVSLTVFSLLTSTLSSRPESPVLWVYFLHIFSPPAVVLSFSTTICLLLLSELFQCFLDWLCFFCFSLT